MKLKDQVALITGAGRNIGKAMAKLFASEGAKIIVAEMHEGRGQAVVDEINQSGGQAALVLGDVSKSADVQRMVQDAVGKFGGIDILVNNAGSTPEDGIDRVDFEKRQYSVSLKLFGYARFAQSVLPEMRARKWGRIVNIIGRSGHQPRPVYLAGGSINAGLLNLTKALAEECAKDNILVTGVNPGPIDTPRWRTLREAAVEARKISAVEFDARAAASTALGRLGHSEEVAGIVAFLCSDRASYITGEILNVDGGGTRCI